MWRKARLSKREREAMSYHVSENVNDVMDQIDATAKATDATLHVTVTRPVIGIRSTPSQEEVQRWLKHSVGSWKRGYRAAG